MLMKKSDRFDDFHYNNLNLINEVKIYNEMQNQNKILIFDLRKREDYIKSHVEYSINIPYDQHDEETFSCVEKIKKVTEIYTDLPKAREMLEKYKRFFIVIIMSEMKIKLKHVYNFESIDNEEVRDNIYKSHIFYNTLLKNKVRELGLYNLGFRNFDYHYTFLTHGLNKKQILK